MFSEMDSKLHKELIAAEYSMLIDQINNRYPIFINRDVYGVRVFAF